MFAKINVPEILLLAYGATPVGRTLVTETDDGYSGIQIAGGLVGDKLANAVVLDAVEHVNDAQVGTLLPTPAGWCTGGLGGGADSPSLRHRGYRATTRPLAGAACEVYADRSDRKS
jgi:hypothetical protein